MLVSFYHRPSPEGGGGQANIIFYGDLNDHFTLQVGEMREVCFSEALNPGENSGLLKRNRSISSCLTSTTERPLYRRTRIYFLFMENVGGPTLRYFYVQPFPSCYSLYLLLQI